MNSVPTNRPRVLIEDWLPVTELGIESRRERAAASALPPLSFLHIWWARRPLVASAAVVLAGILPSWSQDLADAFPEATQLQSERVYHEWLLHLVGIWGDPVTARRILDAANASGIKISGNGYGYKQAFRNAIPREDIDLLHDVLRRTWGELPLVADPTAGGGSIPFAAMRLGLPVYANDLCGVAASALKAGVEIPAREGTALTPHLRHWGEALVNRVEKRLKEHFPLLPGENVIAYIWANAVACPRTGRLVPLMPDMWLRKEKGKEAAVHLVTEVDGVLLDEPHFKVITGKAVDAKAASVGTVGRGNGISPYDNLVIDGAYIKTEAQEGRMRQVLYALAVRTASGKREFRAPSSIDQHAIAVAADTLSSNRSAWQAEGILPSEDIPQESNYDRGHRLYGINSWLDMFTPRQALVHAIFSEEFIRLIPEARTALGDKAEDVLFAIALMQGKALNWNARASTWDVSRQKMRSVFEKHNFSFKWTFAEFEGATALYSWCLDQLIDAYGGIAGLIEKTGASVLAQEPALERSVTIAQGGAANLSGLKNGEVVHLCMDPPYYDNVMYAELADFFYVWEKHTLGSIAPAFFREELTDKENEAVANPARFVAMGKRKQELADLDYEAKMTSIFAECRRVLRDDGVMSVMFTHKRAEAWDTLGMGLLQAGFTVETSWPVNTESEQSMHQANKNSAASTIMLVCRKRLEDDVSQVFLDDIEAEIRAAAREAVARFRTYGIDGVDLLLSTYGPVLSVISSHWPVHSTQADAHGRSRLLRPDEALALAREEVVRLQRQRIIGREVQIDNHSDFVLLSWENFKALEFPFDEARRLALAVGGLDLDELAQARILEKKSGTVRLLPPEERLRRGSDDSSTGVRTHATGFEYMNDALDTVLHIASVDGMTQGKAFMDRVGLTGDERFLAYVQGMANALPRTKIKGEWVIPGAGLLDTLVTAYLPDVTLPVEPTLTLEVDETSTLFE
jgi:adenine-specific DNA methylase